MPETTSGKRRLSAVLLADIANYTRLVEQDTDGTVVAWTSVRADVVDPTVERFQGKVVKYTGDGFLAEFSSVQDAVACGCAMQEGMAESTLDFRMGISLGDVIDDGKDIHGEGVNIAARIEALAEPGNICVAGSVYDAVRNRLKLGIEDLGEHQVKHVSAPIRVYQIRLAGGNGLADPQATSKKPRTDNAGPETGQPAEKPSIAVLPFSNMSNDPDQEFFVDGLTEDILTELSRRHELFVISRNSTFVYKGQAVNLREIAEKLKARYIVEGSVRKAGNRLRVTAQLIDAKDDIHIWAERYDRDLDDIFALQDEITASIVATLPGRIEAATHHRITRKKPSSLAAYECLLAAKVLHHRSNRADNVEALKLVERALELDPNYAHAHAWRGCILGQAWGWGWAADSDATFAESCREMDLAIGLDDDDADVHRLMAARGIITNDFERAMKHQKRALELNPNYDLVVVQMGELYNWLGRSEEAIAWITKAMQLNPHHPPRFWSHLGKARFTARQYRDAVDDFMRMPSFMLDQHAFVAACYGWLGDSESATRHVRSIRDLDPSFDVERFLTTVHYAQETDQEHLRAGLRKAGLDDGA